MRVWLIFAAAGSVSACSLLVSLDDLGSNGDAGLEGGSDATQDAPVDASQEADAGFNPLDVGGLELWVAADVGATELDGGATWLDQSPKHHTVAADGGTCLPPALMPSAINKLPAFSFNPYDPDCFNVSAGFDDFTGGLAIMVVAQPQSCNSAFISGAAAYIDLSGGLGVNDISFGRNPNPANTSAGDIQLAIENGDAGFMGVVSADSGTSWLKGVTHLYEVVMPAGPEAQTTSAFLYLDGTQLATPTLTIDAPLVATRGENYIGKAPNAPSSYIDLCGYVGEIVVYKNVLSDKDRKNLEAYFKAKWGL